MQSLKQIATNPTANERQPETGRELEKSLALIQADQPTDSTVRQILFSEHCDGDCGGTGWRMVPDPMPRDPLHERAERCACIYQKIIATSLPSRYQKASLNDFTEARANAIREWLQKPTDGLLITGGPGAGKTYLAAAIFITVVNARQTSIKFKRAAQLFQAIRDSYGQEDVSEEEILGDYIKPRFLVLDDLGAGSLSDHERRYTLEVIDRRLNAERPTIITTNLTLKEISERMDERIASRMNEYKLLEFKGEDRRGKKG
jgi:DNA replication protein DnaC